MKFLNIYSLFILFCIGAALYFVYHIHVDGVRKSTQTMAVIFSLMAVFCGYMSFIFGKKYSTTDLKYNAYEVLISVTTACIVLTIENFIFAFFLINIMLPIIALNKWVGQKLPLVYNVSGAVIVSIATLVFILFLSGISIFAMQTPDQDLNGLTMLIAFIFMTCFPFTLIFLIFLHFGSRKNLKIQCNHLLANQ